MADNGTFHWNELMTNDPEGAKAFYGGTIGWTFNPMEMDGGGIYWVCMNGEQPCAGIMDMTAIAPEGTPPHWFSYLAVNDMDSRLARATDAGGRILREPFEVPGIGRIVIVQDPQGAVMGWITPAS